MKIKKIKMEGFRRFKNLTIKGLPETARLIVMVGPNGSGKSSVFDALLRFRYQSGGILNVIPDSYFIKFDLPEKLLLEGDLPEEILSEEVYREPEVEFHTEPPTNANDWRRSVHVRSAYRNDILNKSSRFLQKVAPLIEVIRFNRLAENDQAVASNYDRILGPWVERVSARVQNRETVDDIEDDLYGELQDAIQDLFRDPQLTLIGMGNPKDGKIFEFNKGTSHGFSYENLSSGEKAALDLILDIIVAKTEFNDTVFCIDEPESHVHTKLQGPLLGHLYKLIPENSQLWIATHSIGMVRKAQDLWREDPNSVVFLDFGKDHSGQDLDFDKPVILTPAEPNPDLWERTYNIALGDIVELLITSEQFIFCEGDGFDETCYQAIFTNCYPETRFFSVGGKGSVFKVVEALKGKIAKGVKIMGVVDRDRSTDGDIKRNRKKGIRTLTWKRIEDYLLHDDVLTQLCVDQEKPDKVYEFLQAKNEKIEEVMKDGSITDKRRPIVQRIQEQAEVILGLVHSGDTVESFMTDILALLIKPGMAVSEQLHEDIFGD